MADPPTALGSTGDPLVPGFTWEKSRSRWRASTPDVDLTWGVEVTGDAFISKLASYGVFGPDVGVVEIGPGYGRMLAAARCQGVAFASWLGVDLSAENVEYLRKRFPEPNVNFVRDDVETLVLERPAGCVISSLTFKHLYPSFEKALQSIARQLAPGGAVAFDLIEGSDRRVEHDGVTYVRSYERVEVSEILVTAGLNLIAFDEVLHHPELPGSVRLLVIARRPI
jgi:SAM-dependent methyltransferase